MKQADDIWEVDLREESSQENDIFNTALSRRKLLKGLALATLAATAAPKLAFADNAKVNAAKRREQEAQEKLDQLGKEAEELNVKLSQTYSDLSDVEDKIEKVEGEITKLKGEIAERQAILEKRMIRDYKGGASSFLSLLLNASTFKEFTSNLFFFQKITSQDKKLIAEINAQKEKLAQEEETLNTQKESLQKLQGQLEIQKDEVAKKQEEASEYLQSCSQELKDAIRERDAELAAAAEERRRQQQGGYVPEADIVIEHGRGSLSGVLQAADLVPSPGIGLCAMWVSRVFSAAGFSYPTGNANDMYYRWCHTSDRNKLKPGMIVAVSTHPFSAAGRIYGHVGIYLGNGVVRDNIGYIRTISVDEWINFYSTVVPVRWGWINGIALS